MIENICNDLLVTLIPTHTQNVVSHGNRCERRRLPKKKEKKKEKTSNQSPSDLNHCYNDGHIFQRKCA